MLQQQQLSGEDNIIEMVEGKFLMHVPVGLLSRKL